jgi:hypothetical protein
LRRRSSRHGDSAISKTIKPRLFALGATAGIWSGRGRTVRRTGKFDPLRTLLVAHRASSRVDKGVKMAASRSSPLTRGKKHGGRLAKGETTHLLAKSYGVSRSTIARLSA